MPDIVKGKIKRLLLTKKIKMNNKVAITHEKIFVYYQFCSEDKEIMLMCR